METNMRDLEEALDNPIRVDENTLHRMNLGTAREMGYLSCDEALSHLRHIKELTFEVRKGYLIALGESDTGQLNERLEEALVSLFQSVEEDF